jgi:hypothetical protein
MKDGVFQPNYQKLNNLVPDTQIQNAMAQAIHNSFHFSPNQSINSIADLVTGIVTKNYVAHPTPIAPDKTYGVPRVSIMVEIRDENNRPTGMMGTMVLPKEDYNNLKAAYNRFAASKVKTVVPPPPAAGAIDMSKRFAAPPLPPVTDVRRRLLQEQHGVAPPTQ